MAIKKGEKQSAFRIPTDPRDLSERDADILNLGPVEVARKYNIKPQAVSARKNSLRKIFGKDFKADMSLYNRDSVQNPDDGQQSNENTNDDDDGMIDLQPISASTQIPFRNNSVTTKPKMEQMKRDTPNNDRRIQPMTSELPRRDSTPKRMPVQTSSQTEAVAEQAHDNDDYALQITFGNISMKLRNLPPKVSVDAVNNSVSFS